MCVQPAADRKQLLTMTHTRTPATPKMPLGGVSKPGKAPGSSHTIRISARNYPGHDRPRYTEFLCRSSAGALFINFESVTFRIGFLYSEKYSATYILSPLIRQCGGICRDCQVPPHLHGTSYDRCFLSWCGYQEIEEVQNYPELAIYAIWRAPGHSRHIVSPTVHGSHRFPANRRRESEHVATT